MKPARFALYAMSLATRSFASRRRRMLCRTVPAPRLSALKSGLEPTNGMRWERDEGSSARRMAKGRARHISDTSRDLEDTRRI
jgi:hypothetical protein